MNNKFLHGIAVLLWLLFFSNDASSQTAGSINHYQKKCDLDVKEVLIPCDSFHSGYFTIIIPRDLYNSGNIGVKKMRFSNGISASCRMIFEDDLITSITYQVKTKKADELMSLLEQQNNQRTNKTCVVNSYLSKNKQRSEIKLSL